MYRHIPLFRRAANFFLIAAALSSVHGGVVPMQALQGEWVDQGGDWSTAGERPPAGWYLRSQDQYGIGSFSFDLKKREEKELVFVYLRDWQIVLRPDSITARYSGFVGGQEQRASRYWDRYWFTATRPMPFTTTEWQSFEVALAGGGILIRRNGEEVLQFQSPAAEWAARVKKSGKFAAFPAYEFPADLPGSTGDRQVLILQGYGNGLDVRNVTVKGTGGKPAENFQQVMSRPEVLPADADLPLRRPDGPVQIDWQLDAGVAAQIAQLPPVPSWRIGRFVATRPETRHVAKKPAAGEKSFPQIMAYSVGASDPGGVPDTLVIRSRYPAFPQEARVDFNLAEAGIYTLKLGWGDWGLGWGPNIVEVKVDDKPVLLESYRALMKYGAGSPGMEAIPLALSAGPHRISIALVTDRFGMHILMKNLFFPIQVLELVKGNQEHWKIADAASPKEETQRAPAIDDPPAWGEWNGAALNYLVKGLQPGESYDVHLTFLEVESNKPGLRTQDISINGRPVAQNLDVFTEAGWNNLLEKNWPVTAEAGQSGTGEIRLQIQGKPPRRKAFVNGIDIRRKDGSSVFRENFGWHVFIARQAENERSPTPELSRDAAPAEPPRWTPQQAFDGFNLMANPHFSLEDAERPGRPAFWYSLNEIAQHSKNSPLAEYKLFPGSGDYACDPSVGHQHPGALRVGKTSPAFGLTCSFRVVDPHKLQRFSCYVKGEAGSAPVRAKFLWFAINMDAWGGALKAPRMQFLSASESGPVQPGERWREVAVEARPPAEAVYGICIVDVSENAGPSIWIDDAEWNGYGAEPLEITRSFAGYHPRGDKQVIVKSFSDKPVSWKISDAGNQKIAAQGEVADSRNEWFSQRHYFNIDFSSLRAPGGYNLEVTQDGRTVEAAIRISPDTYADLAAMMLGALHYKRFNAAVEKAHDPDMLDYASAPKTRVPARFTSYEPVHFPERIDLIGGYYDAGDAIKHTEFWPSVVLATINARRAAGDDAALRKAAEAEEQWILQAFHKFALEDGTLYTTAKPQGFGLDNVPLYSFDAVPSDIRNVTQTAGSCAMAAFELRETDSSLSRRYLDIAEANYNNSALWKIVEKASEVGPREISFAAKTLWAEMYLNKLSRAADYEKRMARSVDVLARGLKNRAYANLMEMWMAADQNGAALQDCAWVAALFLRMYPGHPGADDLKAGLRAFAAHVEELSADTIWGQAAAMNTVKAGTGTAPGSFPTFGATSGRNIGYWPMLAYSLAEIGMVLEDEKIILLAERQLQWCLGKNQVDLSVVQGVGDRFVAGGDLYWWRDQFFNDWIDSPRKAMFFPGYVPSAAFRDIGDGTPTSAALLMAGDKVVSSSLYPTAYPIVPAQPPYGVRPGGILPSEVYLPQLAQFNLAASSVAAGLKWIELRNSSSH